MASREDAISHLQTIWAWAAIEDIRPREWEKVRHWVTDAIELLKADADQAEYIESLEGLVDQLQGR